MNAEDAIEFVKDYHAYWRHGFGSETELAKANDELMKDECEECD